MRVELTFWDYITLGLALLFVIVYTVLKIKELFNPSSNGCGGCSGNTNTCSAPLTKKRLECERNVQTVSVSSIRKKSDLINEDKPQHST